MRKEKILALIPIIVLLFLLVKFHPNLPFWDEWELVPLVNKFYLHQLSLRDLLAPHNEHIPFFPRVFLLLIIILTRWSVLTILLFNLLLTFLMYLVLNKIVKNYLVTLRIKTCFWMYFINSLIIFSLAQWENWLWGWQMEIFLSVLVTLVGLLFWTKFNWKIKNFLILILLGIIASFSFASGIVFWLIGLLNLILLSKKKSAGKIKRNFLLVWVLITITIIYLQPSKISGFDFRFYGYIFSYLGSPLLSFNPYGAMICGFTGFILFSFSLFQIFRRQDKNIFTLLPVINLGLFSLGSSFLTAFARSDLGILQAISSRYITISNFFWIAVIYLLIYWSQVIRNKKYQNNVLSKRSNLIIYTIIFLLALNSFLRIFKFPKQYQYLSEAQDALISGRNEVLLKRLYYSEKVVRERSEILKKYQLAIYQD